METGKILLSLLNLFLSSNNIAETFVSFQLCLCVVATMVDPSVLCTVADVFTL